MGKTVKAAAAVVASAGSFSELSRSACRKVRRSSEQYMHGRIGDQACLQVQQSEPEDESCRHQDNLYCEQRRKDCA